MQVDYDLKSKCKNRKGEKLKGDSVKIASVEFRKKKRLKQLCCHTMAGAGPETELPHQTDQV